MWRTRFRRRYFIRQNQKVVISVGHYMVRKGIIDFIDLASKMPDTVFIWFGHTGRVLITKDVIRAIDRATPNVLFP